jgi:hypothetical protein
MIKVKDGIYRIPINAGEYVGFFRFGRLWLVSHPRHTQVCASFKDAKEVAKRLIQGLG